MELERLLRKNKWCKPEIFHRHRPFYRHPKLVDKVVPFQLVFESRLRVSYFGIFIKEFNENEIQNLDLNRHKLGMLKWNILHKIITNGTENTEPVLEHFFSNAPMSESAFEEELMEHKTIDPFVDEPPNNIFVDNVMKLLEQWITEERIIDLSLFYQSLKMLRLIDTEMNKIDKSLLKFINLEFLNLSANWLRDVPGKFLPRKIRFLDLNGNLISDLSLLMDGAPLGLIFLGLRHNRLTNDSSFEVLANPTVLKHLRILDISDNNIMDLAPVLKVLKILPHLINLNLEGNPCTVAMGYKDCVVQNFPQIKYLDQTRLLETDYNVHPEYDAEVHDKCAILTFTCYRVFALPQPPNETFQKKPVHTCFYLEVELPLLDQVLRNTPQEEDKQPDIEEENQETRKPPPPASSKGKKILTIYDAPDEHESELMDSKLRNCFKSDKLHWTKVLEFPDPTIVVEAPDGDLKSIRDTFWSNVMVKLIYLGYLPGEKNPDGTTNEDTIVKKVTLAKFPCCLRNMNWSDLTQDFYWSDVTPKEEHQATPVEGNLIAVPYVENPKPVKAKSGEIIVPPVLFPQILTIEVGFSLLRLSADPKYEKPNEKKKK